jgi:hypothetical protein
MSDPNQIVIPRSFIDLFMSSGRIKPNAPREFIFERYELCEDMATMLTEPAQTRLWDLGITEQDVLERIRRGLVGGNAGLSAVEAVWVTRRLAELLGWPCPQLPGAVTPGGY